jgi:hypothetical protein
MQIAELIVGLGAALFVLTCTVVGVRLLWLAYRTREIPELCIGAGLVCVAGVGTPLCIASGIGPDPVSSLNLPLAAAGLIAVFGGTLCLYAFTWRVFRADAAWAKALVCVAGVAFAIVIAGSLRAFVQAPQDAPSYEAASGWLACIRIAIVGAYLWTGTESWLQYRMARRRLGLGLADPVATNRLLLWSLIGAVEVCINGVDLVLHLHGLSPMLDPRAMAVTASGGVIASAMMYLTFLPPRGYLRWVRGRAERAAA